jgi:SAM-dependent methyltransferase
MSVLAKVRASATRPIRRLRFSRSADYWERRYAGGGSSGAGSYGPVAAFKSDVLNRFVAEHAVRSVLEFGCGDGNQLTLSAYPRYTGLDVSRSALGRCITRFADDESKSFLLYDPAAFVNRGAIQADLTMSLDVILHLVENDVFETHLRQLFEASTRYVVIFSSNEDGAPSEPHVKHRAFTRWIELHQPGWTLARRVANPHKGPDSLADFYMYSRR